MKGCKPPHQPQMARYSQPIKCKDMDATNQPQWGTPPYGHSIIITELLTWVHGRMGLVALHDRVQTTTPTSDGKTFTANKVQRHGCYQPTPMGNTPYGHSIIITELLTWVHGRMGLVALHDRVQTTTPTSDGKTWMLPTNTNGEHPIWPFYYHNRALDMGTWKDGTSSTT
jgi:hypothetical protein